MFLCLIRTPALLDKAQESRPGHSQPLLTPTKTSHLEGEINPRKGEMDARRSKNIEYPSHEESRIQFCKDVGPTSATQ